MIMRNFLAEIWRRDRLLALCGWFQIALLAGMFATAVFDQRQILGLSPWVKPSKFAASILIYCWTVAWLLPYLPGPRGAIALIRWGITVTMVVEMVCIVAQSARGVRSHFNTADPFDNAVFGVMGGMIVFNTLLEFLLLVLFFRPGIKLPAVYLWGIRLGLVGTLFSAAVGLAMVHNRAHAVGVPDGGPGLPFVNWSTEGGDLRVAHALGLHAFQVFAICGWLLSRRQGALSQGFRMTALATIVVLYGAAFAITLAIALAGRPLVFASLTHLGS
jgi:hypothetical protein